MNLSEIITNFNPSEIKISKPYIIAEAGVNHECDMNLAKRLIEEAALSGANAIKFQSYKADTIASKNSPAYWDLTKETITSQHQLFKKYDKFWKSEFEDLKVICDKNKIDFLSTPFDLESALFLNDLMDVYKISSSDLNNKPFIEYICKFNKPIILSTGASNLDEIKRSAKWIEKFNIKYCLMHCILNYPTLDINANLGMIVDLKLNFPNQIIGYSDHTLPNQMENIITATLLGSGIIEKHFTHDKTLPGNDHYHAMDKLDLILLQEKLDNLIISLGSFKKTNIKAEDSSRKNARRSLFYIKDIKKNNVIKSKDIICKRPGNGLSPIIIDKIIGKKLTKDVEEDDFVQLSDF